jgi:hypothetical protein
MNRRNVVRLALAAALFGAAIPAVALAQFNAQQDKWWTPQTQGQNNRHGGWNQNRASFDGRWVAEDRSDFGDRGGNGAWFHGRQGGRGMTMLPDFLNIDQQRRLVLVADFRNNPLQVISIDNGFRPDRSGASYLKGQIQGSQIVAFGQDSRGRRMTQTMSLQDRGRTLVVHTQIERGNWGRMVGMDKVYHRA